MEVLSSLFSERFCKLREETYENYIGCKVWEEKSQVWVQGFWTGQVAIHWDAEIT